MVSKTARWAWTYARMRQLYLTVKRDPKRTECKTSRLDADSDEVARAFRHDVARCSEMMSPGVRCLAG
jgi:hypothetical protein